MNELVSWLNTERSNSQIRCGYYSYYLHWQDYVGFIWGTRQNNLIVWGQAKDEAPSSRLQLVDSPC